MCEAASSRCRNDESSAVRRSGTIRNLPGFSPESKSLRGAFRLGLVGGGRPRARGRSRVRRSGGGAQLVANGVVREVVLSHCEQLLGGLGVVRVVRPAKRHVEARGLVAEPLDRLAEEL